MTSSSHDVPPFNYTPSHHHRHGTYPLAGCKRGKASFMSPSPVVAKELIDRKVKQGSHASFIQLRSCEVASLKLRRQEESCHSKSPSLPLLPPSEPSPSSPPTVVPFSLLVSPFTLPPIHSMRLSASVSERLTTTTAPKEQIDLARKWLKKNLLDQVLNVIERVLTNLSLSDDLRLEALTIRGNVFQRKGQYEFAIRDYREILKAKDKDADTHILNELINCYMKQRMYEEAIATAARVLIIDPSNGIAWKHQGLALFYQGNHEKALTCLRNAKKYGVNDYFVLTTLGEIYSTKDRLPQAISHFAQAYANYQDLYVLTRLGKLYQLAGDFDQAIERFSQAIKKNQNLLHAYRDRGTCYIERAKKSSINLEDVLKAVEDFDYYLTKKPEDSTVVGLHKAAQALKNSRAVVIE